VAVRRVKRSCPDCGSEHLLTLIVHKGLTLLGCLSCGKQVWDW
jgi:uncharacterized Zn finger protein